MITAIISDTYVIWIAREHDCHTLMEITERTVDSDSFKSVMMRQRVQGRHLEWASVARGGRVDVEALVLGVVLPRPSQK